MFKRFFDIIFNIEHFNPHGMKPYDLSRKIKGNINSKEIMIFKAKSISNDQWYIQMMISDNEKFKDFKYHDHIEVTGEPNLFTLLMKGNELIDKWLQK